MLRLPVQMPGCCDDIVVSSRPVLIFDQFQGKLPDRTRMFDCQASTVLGDQRLEPCELAAPNRFDVAVPCRIPRIGRIAERNGPDLQEI